MFRRRAPGLNVWGSGKTFGAQLTAHGGCKKTNRKAAVGRPNRPCPLRAFVRLPRDGYGHLDMMVLLHCARHLAGDLPVYRIQSPGSCGCTIRSWCRANHVGAHQRASALSPAPHLHLSGQTSCEDVQRLIRQPFARSFFCSSPAANTMKLGSEITMRPPQPSCDRDHLNELPCLERLDY